MEFRHDLSVSHILHDSKLGSVQHRHIDAASQRRSVRQQMRKPLQFGQFKKRIDTTPNGLSWLILTAGVSCPFRRTCARTLNLGDRVAIVSVAIGTEAVSLIYGLCDHTKTKEAPEGWRFSKLQEQWLYDEVDVLNDGNGPFAHRILLSTGVTLEIPFLSVIIHRFTVPTVTMSIKQIA